MFKNQMQSPYIKQVIEKIQKQFTRLKGTINVSKKLKGKQRVEYFNNVRDKDLAIIRTYINHLETSIGFSQENLDKQKHQVKQLVDQYKNRLDKYIKKLESSKNDVMNQEVIFEQRAVIKRNMEKDRQQMIKGDDRTQLQSAQAVQRVLRNIYEMEGIAQTVNVQLERQINQLDSIYQTLQDTESSMNRALRHINDFVRSIYTDKIIMAFIVLIIVAIVVIIILTSLGKISSYNQNSLF